MVKSLARPVETAVCLLEQSVQSDAASNSQPSDHIGLFMEGRDRGLSRCSAGKRTTAGHAHSRNRLGPLVCGFEGGVGGPISRGRRGVAAPLAISSYSHRKADGRFWTKMGFAVFRLHQVMRRENSEWKEGRLTLSEAALLRRLAAQLGVSTVCETVSPATPSAETRLPPTGPCALPIGAGLSLRPQCRGLPAGA